MKMPKIKTLITLFFSALFVIFYVSNPGIFRELANVQISTVIVIISLQFLSLIVNDLVTKTVVEELGKRLTFTQGLYSAFISSFGNYFLPFSGGATLRAMYLKRNHGFSYSKFMSMTYGMYIISFLSVSSLVILSLTVVYFDQGIFIPSLFLLMVILLLVTLSLTSSRARVDELFLSIFGRLTFIGRLVKIVSKVIDGWKALVKKKTLLIKLICFSFLNIFLRSVIYLVIFQSLGVSLGIFHAVLYSCIVSLSLYLSLTPGSIGIRESMLLLFGSSIFYGQNTILAVSFIERASLIILLGILFIWFNYFKNERIRI